MFTQLLVSYPSIDPVIFSVGGLAVRWYALAYLVGIIGGWWWLGKLRTLPHALDIPKTYLDDLITWAILGVVLGGRIGYIVFYQAEYYLQHPLNALMLWQGGMSFHGGALGVIIAFYLFARRRKLPYLKLMDMVCCVVPLGLLLGRLANFINAELYGRPTSHQWAMVFPTDPEQLPRHPSQLYEAFGEGVLLLIALNILARFGAFRYPGLVGGLFLLGYGLARFVVEYTREPDAHLGLLSLGLSMGQWLCIPMMLAGAGFALYSRKLYSRKQCNAPRSADV